jgi:hypothetical protein
MRCRWVRRAIAGPQSRSSDSIGSRGCQGPLDVSSGSGQALRSDRVLRSFLRCVCTASEEVRGAIGLALGHGVDFRSTGRSLTGRANCESAPKRDPTSDRPQLLDTLKEILFRVGSRSALIGTSTPGVLSGNFSRLLLFRPGSRFGADSQSSSPNSWLGAAFSHVLKTMSSGLRQRQSEPTLDRGSKGRRPDNLTAYSPEQIISHATAAGRTAYAAVIRAGRTVALAECAYNRAYIRTIPPGWVALLDPPTPPRRVR